MHVHACSPTIPSTDTKPCVPINNFMCYVYKFYDVKEYFEVRKGRKKTMDFQIIYFIIFNYPRSCL